ncbi:LysR family transcriptional regulator [Burkholderia sp. L27(2015)]|uniref:LysR family transcriptional regulator n=1 Tax=Burkholderia sp. L27(2015) TaxID=1641858 RepID=UPI00131ECF83|nr:LysR family transcriptional regulator [Burkholderia sp. L27(2015)]
MLTSAPLSRDTAQVETRLSASEIANISLRQLKIFVTVARKASFTRAADEFGLTQSAVSRCIRELEDELHLRLFDRTTRQVALTQAGHYLVARVSPLLEEIEATLRDSHGAQDGQRGVVHVSSSPILSSILMPSCIAGCRNTYPNISLVLKDKAQPHVLESVRSGETDFGVVIEPPEADDMLTEPLFFDPFCVVLPVNHPLAANPVIEWQDLTGLPLVTLDDDSGSRPKFDYALAVHGVPRGAVQELAHASAVFRMVEVGLGLGVVPTLTLSLLESQRLVVRPLQPEIRVAIMLVRRKGRSLRPNATAIWAQLAHLLASFETSPLAAAN